MSEFVLIVPEGWTQIDLDAAIQLPGVTITALKSYIQDNSFATLAQEISPLLPVDVVISAAQIINDETFLVKLG